MKAMNPTRSHRRHMLLTLLLLLAVATGYTAYSAGTVLSSSADANIVGTEHAISKGFGLDSCTVPSVNEMKEIIEHSFNRYWGFYLGGVNTECSNPGRTWFEEVHVSQLPDAREWSFTPFYVGYQAPCPNEEKFTKMSENPEKAAEQAITSVDNAVAYAKKDGFNAGTIIYYDMEGYEYKSASCTLAVRAFVNRWAGRLKEKYEYESGYYSSDCSSGTDGFWELPHRLNDIFMSAPGESNNAPPSVYALNCTSKEHWPIHRLHQYRMAVIEHAGKASVEVDKDCAYGMVDGTGEGSVAECYE
jgi:hypothetical protein